jgi:non-heme chloroperoxidase
MTRRKALLAIVVPLALVASAFAAAIVLGGPKRPAPMASVDAPFKSVDFSGLPPLRRFQAGDGASLAYREYAAAGAPKGSVVLVHGSSASGASMHVMAKAFAQAGYATYALDMRGHGASGTKGRIAYIGQLEDDVDAFARAVPLARPATLAGFSSGGGFVLRFAGSARQQRFDRYLLLSPFLSQDAPTYRADAGGWVSVGVPRVVALAILNSFGVRALNDLPVTRFAVAQGNPAGLTDEYSFALAANFRPQADYEANIRAVRAPCAVLVGAQDELFRSASFEPVFRKAGKDWPVKVVPGVGHVGLTLDPQAVAAAVAGVDGLAAGPGN